MRIRLVALAALFASLATASAASAQVAPVTSPIATPTPAPAPPGIDAQSKMAPTTPTFIQLGAPTQTGPLATLAVATFGQLPAGALGSLPTPSAPKEKETIDDEMRERQEQMDRLMELMRQMQEQRDAAARRTAGG